MGSHDCINNVLDVVADDCISLVHSFCRLDSAFSRCVFRKHFDHFVNIDASIRNGMSELDRKGTGFLRSVVCTVPASGA
jgi:hypothetical protein